MASWRDRAIPVDQTPAPQPSAGQSWRAKAQPVDDMQAVPAEQPQPFGYGDALKRGISALGNVGSLVPYGYAKMYEPLTDLFAGDDGVNPVTQLAEQAVTDQYQAYQELPQDPRIAGFVDRADDEGVMSALTPDSMSDLFSGLDAGAKLLVGELPGMIVGGGVGGRVAREAAEPVVQRIANETAQRVAGKAATGVGVQSGAVALPSTSASVSENLQDGMTTEDAVTQGLLQAGVETAVNAPAGAIAPFNLGGPLRNALTQGAAQTTAGVVGAAAGAEVVGKDISTGELALEGLFGLASVPVDLAVSRMLAARDNGVDLDNVTPEMEAAANSEEAAAIVAEIERRVAEGTLRPEEVGPAIAEITGQNVAPPVDRRTPEGRRSARQTESELGELFAGTDVLPRDQVQPTEDGGLDIPETAAPVRDMTGNQAAPDTFGAQAIVGRVANEQGITLTPENARLAARDIAADPAADANAIVRGYSTEGQAEAFGQADARRRRRGQDNAADLDPERDYRAGAGRESDLSPRMRQELEETARSAPAGVNVGQPGQPRSAVDRISTDLPGGLRGDFQPGSRPGAPRTDPNQGRDFDGNLSDRIAPQPDPQQGRIGDDSGIGPREQAAREADRRGSFQGRPPRDIDDYLDLAREADRAQAAIEASELDPQAKAAARDRVDEIFNGRGDTGSMSLRDATAAVRGVTENLNGEQPTGQRAEPEAEPESTAPAEPEAENTTRAEPEPEADTTADEPDVGGKRGFAEREELGSRDAELVRAVRSGRPEEVARYIEENAPFAVQRTIAKMVGGLLRRMDKAGVAMTIKAGRPLTGSRRQGERGSSRLQISRPAGGGKIKVEADITLRDNGGFTIETALHELVHMATQTAVAMGRRSEFGGTKLAQTVKQLDALQRAVRNRLAERSTEAFTGDPLNEFESMSLGRGGRNNAFQDTDEMLAWGLTNPDMQRFLEDMPYQGSTGWAKLVQIVRNILGLPVKEDTGLSELLKLTQRLASEDMGANLATFERSVNRNSQTIVDTESSYQVDNDKEGVSKDPGFKPNAIVRAIRSIAGKEAAEFGLFAESISMMKETFDQVLGGARASNRNTKRSLAMDFWRTWLASADGSLRVLVKRFDSDLLQSIPDMFHATSGNAKGVGQTFDEAIQARNTRLSEIDTIISDMRDNGVKSEAQRAQIVRLLENPKAPRRGAIGDAANKIEKYLKDELAYLREAGVEVGEVKDGYFPREMDAGKVDRDRHKFIEQAIKAYKEMGLSDDAASTAAQSYWESLVYGVSGRPGFEPSGGQTPSFVEGRVFTPKAAAFLNDFRVTDIDAVLGSYTQRATRRAEIARRFGDNWANWADMEAQMIKDDPDVRGVLPDVRDLVAVSAGIPRGGLRHGTRSTLSMVRTVTTLATLPKSAMSSLGELVIAPTRGTTGSIPGDLGYQMLNVMQHFGNTARWLSGLGRSEKLQQTFDLAEDIGIIAGTGHNSLMAARFAGGDPVGRAQSKVLAGFFKSNMLEYLTNYTRVTSMRYGQVFMRRVSKQMAKNPNRSGQFLRELGVPAGKEKAFADWLLNQEDGLADVPAGEFANVYRNGLQRFVDQTVMRPSNSTRPKWAAHPAGAVIFQLQNFAYAFQKNVINRQVRTINDLDGLDKLAYSASMLTGMALLVGAQGMFRFLRDELYNEEINDRKTTGAFVEGAVSQAGLFGVADTYFQQLNGIRYQRSMLQMFLGPALGGVSDAADDLAAAALNNSDNTNTAELNMMKSVYDWMLEPVMQAGLAVAPGGPITRPLTSFMTIYAVPKGRDSFAEAVAGPPAEREPQPIESTFEFLFGGDSADSETTGRVATPRASSRTATAREATPR